MESVTDDHTSRGCVGGRRRRTFFKGIWVTDELTVTLARIAGKVEMNGQHLKALAKEVASLTRAIRGDNSDPGMAGDIQVLKDDRDNRRWWTRLTAGTAAAAAVTAVIAYFRAGAS